jgi:hypothetical protein
MSSQAFLWVNVGLGLILILIFLFGKKGSVLPSRLNLRRQSSSPTAPTIVTRSVETAGGEVEAQAKTKGRAKDLNVIFLYNGHNFDAYEILGLPAGASLEMVQRGYQTALQKNGSDHLFLEAAFRAIQENKKS